MNSRKTSILMQRSFLIIRVHITVPVVSIAERRYIFPSLLWMAIVLDQELIIIMNSY